MRAFDYIKEPEKLLTPEIVQMIGKIHEHKGKQELFLEANIDELKTLLEVALIQSTGASNRIEGIYTTDKRLEELVSQKAEPRNRSEQEISGYREVLSTIHESYEYIVPRPNIILQLHRDLYSYAGSGGEYKNADNVIAETDAEGHQKARFIPVPAFNDLTVEEAHAVARHAHLTVVVTDSLYDDAAKPGVVLEQSPVAGAHVKENRLIHLIINAHNPEKVVFPNLQNAAYRQTLQTLTSRGFKIGHIEYAPSEFHNLVLDLKHDGENIVPGSLLTKGAVIDIVLGSGNGRNTVVLPQLTGKNLQEALDILRKSYLNLGEVLPDASIKSKNDAYSAVIYEQDPLGETTVEGGTYVNLHITLEKDKIAALDSLMVTE